MTMDVKNVVLAKLSEYAPDQINCSSIDINSTLKEMEFDSLALLQIIYELEEHFSITIDESELSRVDTIADLICVIDKTQKNIA